MVINCIIHHDKYQTRSQIVNPFEHLSRKPQLIYPNPQHTFWTMTELTYRVIRNRESHCTYLTVTKLVVCVLSREALSVHGWWKPSVLWVGVWPLFWGPLTPFPGDLTLSLVCPSQRPSSEVIFSVRCPRLSLEHLLPDCTVWLLYCSFFNLHD